MIRLSPTLLALPLLATIAITPAAADEKLILDWWACAQML